MSVTSIAVKIAFADLSVGGHGKKWCPSQVVVERVWLADTLCWNIHFRSIGP